MLPHFSNSTVRLYLEDNMIRELPSNGFTSTPHLQLVMLQNNRIRTVNTAAFCGLAQLKEINLSGNDIHNITVVPNCKVPDLHLFDLHGNKLLQPPSNLSLFAPHLQTLDLSFNQLQSVTLDASYQVMSQLWRLEMTGNNFHEIHPGDLEAVSENLKVLHLADCGLVYIDPLAMPPMKNLTAAFPAT